MDIQLITQHTDKIVPLSSDDIDTDQVTPKIHLKRITKTGFGPLAFDERHYLPDGSDNPDFNLNKPKHKGASIFTTGNNLDCGSNREHAAWALKDFDLNIIIAGSFSDIFYMNCTKNGTLPIVLNEQFKKYLTNQNNITISLPDQTVSANSQSFHFDIDETWRDKLINGLDDIAIILGYEELTEKYKKTV